MERRICNLHVLIIFFFRASSTALRYSEELTKIAYNGRHYNADVSYHICIYLSCLLTCHTIGIVLDTGRGEGDNSDEVFFFFFFFFC